MTPQRSRRQFFADVGSGMLVATVGYGLAFDMGFTPALADDCCDSLTFGDLEPLVASMQETPVNRLVPMLVEKLRTGTELKTLVGAAALANARTFGGEDYVGFHTMMALAPAYHMAQELPTERQALPIFKVLYRNTNRIQEVGGRKHEVLSALEDCAASDKACAADGEALRTAVREKDLAKAEQILAAAVKSSPDAAFNAVLFAVQDNTEVHRVVLPYRAWDLLGIIGKEQAQTLLRQSVHYCVNSEKNWKQTEGMLRPRSLLPKLLDQYKLVGRPKGDRAAEDAWVDKMCRTIFESTPEGAADAVAAALAEGMCPDAIGEAIALAANQLVLRDAGRREREVQPGKPLGSVHGDSIGVHACDSANAWRNMARVSNPRNQVACLVLGAYQVAYDRINRGGDFLKWTPHPVPAEVEPVHTTDPATLISEAESAIKANDQFRACAAVHKYGEGGHDPRPVFDLLLRYAVSEDGALHAEKYYRTVSEEFASARPAFRWRQLVALARVTASEYGRPAPGYAEACQLLRV